MLLIKIDQFENGAHCSQTGPEMPVPAGWAVVPESLGTPESLENFPFGDAAVEDVDGVPTVTGWTPLPVPEPGEPEAGPEPDGSLGDRVEVLEEETAAITKAIERGLRL